MSSSSGVTQSADDCVGRFVDEPQQFLDMWRNEREQRIGILALEVAIKGATFITRIGFRFLRWTHFRVAQLLADARPFSNIEDVVDAARGALMAQDSVVLMRTVQERRECYALRNAYAIEVWRRRMRSGAILYPACAICGEAGYNDCPFCFKRDPTAIMHLCGFCRIQAVGCQLCRPQFGDDGNGGRINLDEESNRPPLFVMQRVALVANRDWLAGRPDAYRGAEHVNLRAEQSLTGALAD